MDDEKLKTIFESIHPVIKVITQSGTAKAFSKKGIQRKINRIIRSHIKK